ncbi:2Fe-2S iron-sulfur cluster-binding protein [Streptomyces inhibens]|uniref:2Fe-2S iron-sulfur cluster-binding protein n=1 Tax=Streptomyces inhibens TaxID=2293571 RepID=UPI0037AD5321
MPYSCQEGICGTCRAKVICGPVHRGPSDLEPADAEAGFALACRTRAAGPGVTLDFDQGWDHPVVRRRLSGNTRRTGRGVMAP